MSQHTTDATNDSPMSDFSDQSDLTADEDTGSTTGDEVAEQPAPEPPEQAADDVAVAATSEATERITAAEADITEAAAAAEAAKAVAEVGEDTQQESDVVTEDELLDAEALAREESPYNRPGRWYVVHTQSGYEKKVKQNLEARISSMNMEERIYEVVIPMEDVVEFKSGKKVVVPKKMFPGYLLVRCELDDDSWFVIRNTPGVTGFVGQGAKPSPLPRKDVEMFLQVPKGPEAETVRKGKPRLEYEVGETVRIKEGPFADFSGEIVDLNEEQLKVKVEVDIFGRPTPVELEFSQIAKL
jgi:transcriptional antiterminator NusG